MGYDLTSLEGATFLCITRVVFFLFTGGIVLIDKNYLGKTSRKVCKGDNAMLCLLDVMSLAAIKIFFHRF